MKKFKNILTAFLVLVALGSYGQNDLVCVEFSIEGESIILPMSAGEVDQLADSGIEYAITDCPTNFDFGGDDFGDDFDGDFGDDFDGDWDEDYDFGDDSGDWENDNVFEDFICVELTVEGETFIIPAVEEMLAGLDAEGLEYTVIDCDGLEGEGSSDSNTDDFEVFNNYGVSDLALYPNPVDNDGIITVNFDSNSEFTSLVSVTNQLGQVVNSIQLTAQKGKNNLQIESASLDRGIYFISIENGNKVYTERVVVK